MKYHVVLEKQEEGGYTVYVPELPGCISQGETKEEAFANIKEAAEVYMEEIEGSKLRSILKNITVVEPSAFSS
ncbi:MAG: type II toxin-antitoxin system HicB family antitoxin [Candidatus Micrarchaeota archaeon]